MSLDHGIYWLSCWFWASTLLFDIYNWIFLVKCLNILIPPEDNVVTD